MDFSELNIKKEILAAIDDLGFQAPTKIQEEIIPLINDGYDVLGQSQTGTGKTLAYAVGIISNMDLRSRDVKALVIVPTRELAMQVSKEISVLGKYAKIKTTCVYGSSSIQDQIRSIKDKTDIVVGTPGRLLDLIKRKVLLLGKINFFVLDEADEMLDMGFHDDLEKILKETNEVKQIMMFSATMPKTILRLAQNYLNPEYKQVSVVTEIKTAQNIKQIYYLVNDSSRIESMCRVMDKLNPNRAIIFCKTKRNADELLVKLANKKYSVDIIHGDISQNQRIATLERFKRGNFKYLIATDVAARGIHVEDIELVINFNLPSSQEAYVHRIGRTGRANKSGIAITFVTPSEIRKISDIEKHIKIKIEKENIPTLDEIVNGRYESIVQSLKSAETDSKHMFDEYLGAISIEDLKALCGNLLEKELMNKLGSDFKKDLTVVSSNNKNKIKTRNSAGGIRLFLTIGKMDNIGKKELLTFLEKQAGIPQGVLFNVEILTKFTFLNIDEKYCDQFISKCNNSKFNRKTIAVEKAK